MDLPEARERLRALAAAAEPRAARGDASDERLAALLTLGRAARATGEPRAADALLAALDLADGLGRPVEGRLAAVELGACLAGSGDARLGRAHLERALEEARVLGAREEVDRAAAELARAWALEGDRTRARAALALAAPDGPRALVARALLERLASRPDEARALLARALAVAATLLDRLEAAAVACAAGQALLELAGPGELPELRGAGEAPLRRALAAVLAIVEAPARDAPRLAVEVLRALTGAAAAELELSGAVLRDPPDPGSGDAEQAPAAAWDLERRLGRVVLRLRGAPPGAGALAGVVLRACARLGEPPPEEATRVLHLLDRLLASDLEGPALLSMATELAIEATGAARGRMVLLPGAADPASPEGAPEEDFVSRSLVRHVVLGGRPLLLEDAAIAPPAGAAESVGARGLRSVLVAPMLGRRGQVVGVVYLDDPGAAGRFGAAELEVASGFAARLGPHAESLLRERRRRAAADDAGRAPASLVAEAPAMRAALALAERAAQTDAPVLIHGEAGVGKELLARHIHAASPRAGGPFVVASCAALPDELVASELFGHRAGAFTGAVADRAGLFQAARGGVLLLDGLHDASPRLQGELLRAVERGEVRPLGGEVERVDVRLVCTLDGDPRAAAGRLRPDLLYRLGVLRIAVPPLRERREDLPRLAAALLERLGAGGRALGPGALARLEAHDWPGNLRELEACLARALLEAGDGPLRPTHLRVEPPREAAPALRLNGRQLRLLDGLRPGQVVRAGEHAQACGVSAATAWRDLTDLVTKGVLEAEGRGRGAAYRLR